MPVPLTGLDVTACTITSGGTNSWIVILSGITTGEMARRVRGGAYTDGAEVSPAEAIVLNISDVGGTEVLDFSYGDTVDFTLDAVGYTIELDEAILANTNYYLDTNGVPFTDVALTTFIGIGDITDENIGTTENTDTEPEYSLSEGVGITEDSVGEPEYSTAEIINIVEAVSVDDEQETHENVGVSETIKNFISDASGSQFTKTSPSSNANWTKMNGDIA